VKLEIVLKFVIFHTVMLNCTKVNKCNIGMSISIISNAILVKIVRVQDIVINDSGVIFNNGVSICLGKDN
jgi:hypothetical protein